MENLDLQKLFCFAFIQRGGLIFFSPAISMQLFVILQGQDGRRAISPFTVHES